MLTAGQRLNTCRKLTAGHRLTAGQMITAGQSTEQVKGLQMSNAQYRTKVYKWPMHSAGQRLTNGQGKKHV